MRVCNRPLCCCYLFLIFAARSVASPLRRKVASADDVGEDVTCPTITKANTPDGTPRPATTGPALQASCDGGRLDSLRFESAMDWMQRRVYIRGMPLHDRPVCRTPSAVHLRLNDRPIRFTPIGDGNDGKTSQVYVDAERRYVLKLLLKPRHKAKVGHADSIARDVCFARQLADLAWAPTVVCHSPLAMVSKYAGRPLMPTDVARRPQVYVSQVHWGIHAPACDPIRF